MLPYQINAEYSYRGQCLALVVIIAFCLAGGVYLLMLPRLQPER
jgi:hypothetical protein